MKIRALKRLAGSYGLLDKGDVIDLPNYVANDLIAMGYAEDATEVVDDGSGQDIKPPTKGRRKRGSR